MTNYYSALADPGHTLLGQLRIKGRTRRQLGIRGIFILICYFVLLILYTADPENVEGRNVWLFLRVVVSWSVTIPDHLDFPTECYTIDLLPLCTFTSLQMCYPTLVIHRSSCSFQGYLFSDKSQWWQQEWSKICAHRDHISLPENWVTPFLDT